MASFTNAWQKADRDMCKAHHMTCTYTQLVALLMLNVLLTLTMLLLRCLVCTVCNEIMITCQGYCVCFCTSLWHCLSHRLWVCVCYMWSMLFDIKQCRAFTQISYSAQQGQRMTLSVAKCHNSWHQIFNKPISLETGWWCFCLMPFWLEINATVIDPE